MRYQIRHARVQFDGDVILRDVNFEVHDREKIAVVGRNGCGKTTLLKLIVGDIEMSNLDSDEECGITMAGGQEIGFLRQVNFVDAEVAVEDIPGEEIWRRCSSGSDSHWRICGVRSAVFPEGSRRKWRL